MNNFYNSHFISWNYPVRENLKSNKIICYRENHNLDVKCFKVYEKQNRLVTKSNIQGLVFFNLQNGQILEHHKESLYTLYSLEKNDNFLYYIRNTSLNRYDLENKETSRIYSNIALSEEACCIRKLSIPLQGERMAIIFNQKNFVFLIDLEKTLIRK